MENRNLLPLDAYDAMIRAMMRPLLPMSLTGGLLWGLFMYFITGDMSGPVAFIMGLGFGVVFWFVFRRFAVRLFTTAIAKAYSAEEQPDPTTEPGHSYRFQLVCAHYKGLAKMIGRLCIGPAGVCFISDFPEKTKLVMDFGSLESVTVKAAEPRKGIGALVFGDMPKIELGHNGEAHHIVVPSPDFTAKALRQGIEKARSSGERAGVR